MYESKQCKTFKENVIAMKTTEGKSKKRERWTEEIRLVVEQKINAFRIWMKYRTMVARRNYEDQKGMVYQIKRRAKRVMWKK